ncbi:hypothetical protein D9M70_336970 [compost metagenome]
MLAEACHAPHLVAEVEVGVDEGIAELGVAAVQLLGIVGELVVVGAVGVGGARRLVVVLLVVDIVVPGRAADAQAAALVREVELGEQVEAVGHQAAAIEVAVAVVQVVVGHQLVVAILHAHRGAVLERVVPANRQVGVTGFELEGLRGQDRTGQQCGTEAAETEAGTLCGTGAGLKCGHRIPLGR